MINKIFAFIIGICIVFGCTACPGGIHKPVPPTIEPHQ